MRPYLKIWSQPSQRTNKQQKAQGNLPVPTPGNISSEPDSTCNASTWEVKAGGGQTTSLRAAWVTQTLLKERKKDGETKENKRKNQPFYIN